MTNLRNLWRLQMLQGEQLKQGKKGVSSEQTKQLKQLKQEIENLQLQLKEIKERHQGVKEKGQQLAQRTQQVREQYSEIDAKLYAGSLHIKEIDSYQHKQSQLKEGISSLEDQELEILQEREDIKKEWEVKKQKLDVLSGEFKKLHQAYLKEKDEIKSRAEGMAREEKNSATTNRFDFT